LDTKKFGGEGGGNFLGVLLLIRKELPGGCEEGKGGSEGRGTGGGVLYGPPRKRREGNKGTQTEKGNFAKRKEGGGLFKY